MGWRSATRESYVLLLTLTIWAFLTFVSTTPATDFRCRFSVNYSALRPESETCNRSPAISCKSMKWKLAEDCNRFFMVAVLQ